MDELTAQVGREVHVDTTSDKNLSATLVSVDDRGILLQVDYSNAAVKQPNRKYFYPWTNVVRIDWPDQP